MPAIIILPAYPTIMTDYSTSKDIRAKRWGMLGVIYFYLLIPGMGMQTIPPILTAILSEFSLSYAQGGLLMSFFALPAIFIAIPAGMIADRYNQKTISIISLILVVAGTVLFFNSSNIQLMLLGRIIIGAGSAALFVLGPQIVAQWFAGKELGLAIGILNSSIPLSSIIALNLFSMIGERAGWRACFYPSVGFPLVAIIVVLFFFTRAPINKIQHRLQSQSIMQEVRHSGLSIWLIAASWMFFNMVIASLITFTPDYLQLNGYSAISAGLITSIIMWPSLVMCPAIGFVMYKLGRKHLIVIVASLLVCVMVALIPYVTSRIILLIALFGIVQAVISPPLFTLASEVTDPQRQGMTFGIMGTCQNIGGMLGPFLFGAVRDYTGAFHSSFMLMAGFMLGVILLFIILVRKQKAKASNL